MDSAPIAVREAPVAAPRSRADDGMRRLLRIPDDRAPVDESETNRIFSVSILLSATRCLLSYVLFPIVLPAVGLAKGVGPLVGIPIGVLALTFDYLGMRRFWLADHHRKWAFSALYAVVGTMVAVLLVIDLASVIS